MQVNNKNIVKIKALSFINKVSEYLIKSNHDNSELFQENVEDSLKNSQELEDIIEDNNINSHELPSFDDTMRSAIINDLVNNSDLSYFDDKLRSSIINNLVYNPQSNSFSVSADLIKNLPPPEQSIEIKELKENTTEKNDTVKDINSLFSDKQNNNFVKIKADTFKERLSGQKRRKVEPQSLNIPGYKGHRIFIHSKEARELGLYEKFYKELNAQPPVFENSLNKSSEKKAPAPPLLDKLKYIPETNEFSLASDVAEKKAPEQPPLDKLKYIPETNEFSLAFDVAKKLRISKPVANTDKYPEIENKELSRTLRIFEEGIFLGMKVNETTRSQVVEFMKPYSHIRFDIGCKDPVLDFEDISVKIYFDSKGVVSEFEFNTKFPGSTSKGLKVGDTIEKAIQIYGPPLSQFNNEALWQNMRVISNSFYIISIKLGKPTQNIDSEKNLLVRNFNLYTEGMLIGVIVGESTKSIIVGGHNRAHVIKFMKDYSNDIDPENTNNSILNYKDIDISVHLDDSDIVSSIDFGKNFIGSTLKGLKIGDPITKAIQIYGEPDIQNNELISWNKFKIYYRDNIITSFKIHC